MRRIQRNMIVGVLLLLWLACQTPGDDQPATAGILAEGVMSTGKEYGICFDPSGREIYFTRRVAFFRSNLMEGVWNDPVQASPVEQHSNLDPFISPDGSKLFFMSNRPINDTQSPEDFDIWMMQKSSVGWGEPMHLGDVVNSHPARE